MQQPPQAYYGQQQPMSPVAMNVPVVQSAPTSPSKPSNPEWEADYFCNQGFGNCLCGWCFPCCALADARSKFDGSNRCFNLVAIGACVPTYMNIIREGYGINGTCLGDIFCGLCCVPCVATRLRGEVLARGKNVEPAEDGSNRWAKDPVVACMGCPRIFACLLGPLIPLYMMWTFAKARSDNDGSNCLFNFFCIPPCVSMNVIRESYGIEGTWLSDVIYACCCPFFAAAMVAEHVNEEAKK